MKDQPHLPEATTAGVPDDRWGHLVSAAFRLEETREDSHALADATLAVVDSALEVFTAQIDPVDDFEGYAVRRLLLSLRRSLSATQRSPK